jgi:DNA-binding NarL/FixJ family response regulator
MKEAIKLYFADDKEKFRRMILGELDRYREIHCIGEAENGIELLELLDQRLPDVVLLDLDMPVMDGNEAMNQIMKRYPRTRVIILSMHYEPMLVENYIARGARGYIPKDEICGNIEVLIEGIRKVHSGEPYIRHVHPESRTNPFKDALKPKHKDIIPLMCDGWTNKDIATQLGRHERTVEKQRHEIYSSIQTKKAADFFRYAFSKGLQFLGKGL